MTGIVCLDQEDGLLFNGRRQSRDRVVTEKILSMTEGKPLWMSAYSRRIFPEDAPVCVAEDLVGKLEELAENIRVILEERVSMNGSFSDGNAFIRRTFF